MYYLIYKTLSTIGLLKDYEIMGTVYITQLIPHTPHIFQNYVTTLKNKNSRWEILQEKNY